MRIRAHVVITRHQLGPFGQLGSRHPRLRLYTAAVRASLPVIAAAWTWLVASPALAAQADRPPFDEWLEGVRTEARARGIREETIAQALAIDEPLAVVVDRDRSQAESVLPLETYVSRRVTARVTQLGRTMYERHKDVIDDIEHRYGVPGRIAVAIWGIESNFGRFSGTRPTVTALATLAWDPRRSSLFRNELFDALTIVDRGDIEFSQLKGSWAGAMGQAQFMPSSYLRYAQDFDGDGRRDIWTSVPDVLASIANYLRERGWTPGDPWGQEVSIPAGAAEEIGRVPLRTNGCRATREMTEPLTLDRWRELGVRRMNGRPLTGGSGTASLVSGTTRRFLVTGNYNALLEYNCAHAYALSVALLADRIAQTPRRPADHPPAATPLPSATSLPAETSAPDRQSPADGVH